MAKFLDTQAISNELMKLIKEAKDKIILVSYSFKVNPQIQERLKTASKVGTLSEIVIVYGKTDLKESELSWIKEIQDLKIYEKSNLHAKCYLNEQKAIICSMNLYDYSQQNNIEMGILISKEHDSESYEELMKEIVNIKINGIRKSLEDLQNKATGISISKTTIDNNAHDKKIDIKEPQETLNLSQELNLQMLKSWRLKTSKFEKTAAFQILTDEEIKSIVTSKKIDKNRIFELLPKKNAIRFAEEILKVIEYNNYYTIARVLNVWYQSDTSKYDRVKLKIEASGEEKWFDTTQELPSKDRIVAVRLNATWFNDYFYLN